MQNSNKTYFQEGIEVIGEWLKGFGSSNKAHIYTGAGVAGTILTGAWSAKAGMNSARKIDRKEAELARPLSFGEKVKLCTPEFLGPVATCAATCYSTIKSDVVNTKTITETTAKLIASEKVIEKFQQKTREVLGDKKAKEIQDEVTKENIQENPQKYGQIGNIGIWDDAPRAGNGQLFPWLDEYSGLRFWTNEDYLSLVVMKLREMMRDLSPRDDAYDYYDKIIGIPYHEFLSYMNVPQEQWNTTERKTHGWNKGYAKDGCEDDPIEFYKTTMEWGSGFPVMVLHWEKDPSDMRLGRLIKSSNI